MLFLYINLNKLMQNTRESQLHRKEEKRVGKRNSFIIRMAIKFGQMDKIITLLRVRILKIIPVGLHVGVRTVPSKLGCIVTL